jgi:myosin-1
MYYNMKSYKENQCVIISGESGAGKTESAKRIMQYIASVSSQSSSNIQKIKDMVLATNPLLEAFGCAKTLRNNNSSRHGKYLQIEFNEFGEPVGAHITNYLLEKARVVGQIKTERNFHIFYQLTKTAPQNLRDEFGIQPPTKFRYTNDSDCISVEGIDDTVGFQETLRAMEIIGLTDAEKAEMFRLLSAVLWIGNINFKVDDNDHASVKDKDVANFVAYLLQTDSAALEKALIFRTVETPGGGRRNSVYEVPLNKVQARAVRDALAKAIYNNLFDWIVERINQALQAEETKNIKTIGILDIYGFEIFENNSFEQICINYVNEKLQQIFIQLTLKSEQDEYISEKISWTPIQYFNNQIVCDLIEGRNPPGIFAALNDACATAHAKSHAADERFAESLTMVSNNPHFGKRKDKFLIKHYAGDVYYDFTGMTEKNKDMMVKELVLHLSTSSNTFLKSLFPNEVNTNSRRKPATASDKIRSSANDLMKTLALSQPSYIRTIKPNQTKNPADYDAKMVLHQVKYLGLQENIKIRRSGFAYRQTYEKFVERFFLLSKKTSFAGSYIWKGSANDATVHILHDSGIAKSEYQLGTTKLFLKNPDTLFSLEHLRDMYWQNMAIRIQRAWRAHQKRRTEAAIKIQRAWRAWRGKKDIIELRKKGDSLVHQRKERRQFSLCVYRTFMGDYLACNDPTSAGGYLARLLNISDPIIFSMYGQVLSRQPGKPNVRVPRKFLMTPAYFLIVEERIQHNRLVPFCEMAVSIPQIKYIALSECVDDWIALCMDSKSVADALINCVFKTELLAILSNLIPHVDIRIGSSITYHKEVGLSSTIRFNKDKKLSGNDKFHGGVVRVPPGLSPGSESQIPSWDPQVATSNRMQRPAHTAVFIPKVRPQTALPMPASQPLPGQQNVQARLVMPRPFAQQEYVPPPLSIAYNGAGQATAQAVRPVKVGYPMHDEDYLIQKSYQAAKIASQAQPDALQQNSTRPHAGSFNENKLRPYVPVSNSNNFQQGTPKPQSNISPQRQDYNDNLQKLEGGRESVAQMPQNQYAAKSSFIQMSPSYHKATQNAQENAFSRPAGIFDRPNFKSPVNEHSELNKKQAYLKDLENHIADVDHQNSSPSTVPVTKVFSPPATLNTTKNSSLKNTSVDSRSESEITKVAPEPATPSLEKFTFSKPSTTAPPPPKKYRVLYDFESTDPGFLPVKKDELVVFLNHSEDGWCLVSRQTGSEKGWAPLSYLEELSKGKEISKSTTSRSSSPSPASKKKSKSSESHSRRRKNSKSKHKYYSDESESSWSDNSDYDKSALSGDSDCKPVRRNSRSKKNSRQSRSQRENHRRHSKRGSGYSSEETDEQHSSRKQLSVASENYDNSARDHESYGRSHNFNDEQESRQNDYVHKTAEGLAEGIRKSMETIKLAQSTSSFAPQAQPHIILQQDEVHPQIAQPQTSITQTPIQQINTQLSQPQTPIQQFHTQQVQSFEVGSRQSYGHQQHMAVQGQAPTQTQASPQQHVQQLYNQQHSFQYNDYQGQLQQQQSLSQQHPVQQSQVQQPQVQPQTQSSQQQQYGGSQNTSLSYSQQPYQQLSQQQQRPEIQHLQQQLNQQLTGQNLVSPQTPQPSYYDQQSAAQQQHEGSYYNSSQQMASSQASSISSPPPQLQHVSPPNVQSSSSFYPQQQQNTGQSSVQQSLEQYGNYHQQQQQQQQQQQNQQNQQAPYQFYQNTGYNNQFSYNNSNQTSMVQSSYSTSNNHSQSLSNYNSQYTNNHQYYGNNNEQYQQPQHHQHNQQQQQQQQANPNAPAKPAKPLAYQYGATTGSNANASSHHQAYGRWN